MPALFILSPGSRATLTGERLCLDLPPLDDQSEQGQHREIPLRDIEQVVLTESVHFTMPALAECLRRQIPVLLTSRGERLIGLCVPPAPHSIARLTQYRRRQDATFTLALAINWVEAKILNSRRVLQRLAANREESDIQPALVALDELARKCRAAESLDTLRGYEGAAAGRYFETYGAFYPDTCPFERRSRRPPHNAPNAVLSYAYTLMTAEMECHAHTAGLDAAVGFFHEPEDRRPSLALDLIEPFRAPLADALAIDLFSHATLKPAEHFEERDGGIYLNTDGKKRFFVAYERRMTREFQSPQTGQRTTLRAEFHRQTLALKQAILDNVPFEPFLMG